MSRLVGYLDAGANVDRLCYCRDGNGSWLQSTAYKFSSYLAIIFRSSPSMARTWRSFLHLIYAFLMYSKSDIGYFFDYFAEWLLCPATLNF